MATTRSSGPLVPYVFDGHTDVPTRLLESPGDLSRRLPDGHVDLPRLREGGVGGLVFAYWVPVELGIEEGMEHVRRLHRLTAPQLGDQGLRQATSAAGLEEAVAEGAVGVLLGLENGRPLSLAGALEEVLAMGVRLVTLTHVASHEWCDASGVAELHGGLSREGEEIVHRLNRAGVVVDVSHVSDRAVEHVLSVSKAPVVASHSSARALCDHPRNLPDALVREITRAGGVVMANAYPAFLDPEACAADEQRKEGLGAELAALHERFPNDPQGLARERVALLAGFGPQPPVPVERYADHILHLVGVAGPEGVGIGTDFDGIPEAPVGFENCSRMLALLSLLAARGLDSAALGLVAGGNFLRVLRQVESQARH
jgi:membrane dipeptidase